MLAAAAPEGDRTMATRSARRASLAVEALEDRSLPSSTALLPLAAPDLQHVHHSRPGLHHHPQSHHHHHHQIVVQPTVPPPSAPAAPAASFFDVFVNLSDTPGTPSQSQQDRDKAELARRDAAGWRQSAAGDDDPIRKQQKLNAANDADKAAEDWDKAAAARDNGDNDKADKLEQAAQQRENAAREWGANGDGTAAGTAEAAAKALEDQAK
jgi:hypothetical protein